MPLIKRITTTRETIDCIQSVRTVLPGRALEQLSRCLAAQKRVAVEHDQFSPGELDWSPSC